jgi:hypothetical protein
MIAHLQVIIRWRSLFTSMSSLTVLGTEDSTQRMSKVDTASPTSSQDEEFFVPVVIGN